MSASTSGPAYRIETARLVLRCWQPADAPLLADAIGESLDHLRPWVRWAHNEPLTLAERAALLCRFRGMFDLDEDFVYGVFDRAGTRVLGGAGSHARVGPLARELGYWIRAGAVRQGLCNEAVAGLVRVAFEVDEVARLDIRCAAANRASSAVARRLGFRHEATLRRRLLEVGPDLLDMELWTMLPDEYARSPLARVPVAAFDVVGTRLL